MEHTLIKDDLISLAFDFEHVAIFHREPLKIVVPDVGEITSGNGLGGFSHTVFERSEKCIVCGACCRKCRRRVWFWHAGDSHPEDVTPLTVVVNGNVVPMVYHASKERFMTCDYQAEDGRCIIHEPDRRPVHCDFDPFSNIYTVNLSRGKRNLWSRRLPSRNWLWPKCPIDVATIPITEAQIDDDRRRWNILAKHYTQLPGSFMIEGLSILNQQWASRMVPEKNILLEDLLQIS
jgi:NAD-dependent dihydropyrimidine dehydrogenase PreA subunit